MKRTIGNYYVSTYRSTDRSHFGFVRLFGWYAFVRLGRYALQIGHIRPFFPS